MSESKLRQAYELLEAGWCQNYYALHRNGINVPYFHETASCFCISGALLKVEASYKDWDIVKEKTNSRIIDFNDSHTKEEVLELIKSCI